jgi:pimeloyl-ACP methyl ester carboxylesterase
MLPASEPAHRIGTLFWNPGLSAAGAVMAAQGTLPAELRRQFDIVGVDPRGVGLSGSARCAVAVYDPAIPQFPDDRAGYERLIAHNRAAGRSCMAGTGPDLAYFDSVTAARDIDAVRSALGLKKVSWLGLSYGTMLGAEYAQRYPSRVQRMALDGALDHGLDMEEMVRSDAAATEDAFDRFVAWCGASAACALHSRDVAALWDALIARAAQRPVGRPGRQVTAEQIRYLTQSYLTSIPERAVALARAIDAADRGDASVFWSGVRALAASPTLRSNRAITCLDFSPQLPGGLQELHARMREVRQVAPHMGGSSEAWAVMTGCLGWPIPPVDPQRPVHVAHTPPVLVVGSTHDASTPLAWARSLGDGIAGSRLLVDDGDGHGALGRSACVTAAIVAYLEGGALPPPDRICSD